MFERFTDRARRVVVIAQTEARDLQHNYIGTEHLLLGLAREGEGAAALVLTSLEFDFDTLRDEVTRRVPPGAQSPPGHLPFTPRAKKVLEMSLREALQLGQNYVGTEHLLLGIVREGEGVAAQVLGDLPAVRKAVIARLSESADPPPATAIERVMTNDRFRGYLDLKLALDESYENGRAAAQAEAQSATPHECGLPHEITVHITGLPYQDACDWPATIVQPHPGTGFGVPAYVISGDPNAAAVGRFKASFRKFLGVD